MLAGPERLEPGRLGVLGNANRTIGIARAVVDREKTELHGLIYTESCRVKRRTQLPGLAASNTSGGSR